MSERCLMAASLAVLVFHPSLTIKCFKPKSSTASPPREKPPPPPPPPPPPQPSQPYVKKVPSKPKKKQDLQANPSFTMTSNLSNTNKPSSPPILKTGNLFNMVSELVEREPSNGIVKTIFRSGWAHDTSLTIDKVFKVNHGVDVIRRFEEYRETVKSKAAEISVGRRMERLLVDGNELLRFHGAIITCSLGNDGVSTICDKKFCGVCRVIGSNVPVQAGFSSLCQKSWEAHENGTVECLPNGVSARKAIILCRVIAGRIARTREHGLVDGEEGGFDSVVRSTGCKSKSSEELIVFNSCAVLPCFVVIYTVPSSSFGKMQSK